MYTQFLKFGALESGCLDPQSLQEACCSQRTFDQMDLDTLAAFGDLLHLKGYCHCKDTKKVQILIYQNN